MNKLREYRIKARLSAFRLAEGAGTTEIRAYHIERQRYRPRRAEAEGFACVLKTTVQKLFPDGVQQENGGDGHDRRTQDRD